MQVVGMRSFVSCVGRISGQPSSPSASAAGPMMCPVTVQIVTIAWRRKVCPEEGMSKQPTWITVADGKGLGPPKDYVGPVRTAGRYTAVWYQGRERCVEPRIRGRVQEPWLLDLDRPEGFSAALRKFTVKLRTMQDERADELWEEAVGVRIREQHGDTTEIDRDGLATVLAETT